MNVLASPANPLKTGLQNGHTSATEPIDQDAAPQQDLWSSILNSVKSSKAISTKNVVLLGEPASGKSSLLTALASTSPRVSSAAALPTPKTRPALLLSMTRRPRQRLRGAPPVASISGSPTPTLMCQTRRIETRPWLVWALTRSTRRMLRTHLCCPMRFQSPTSVRPSKTPLLQWRRLLPLLSRPRPHAQLRPLTRTVGHWARHPSILSATRLSLSCSTGSSHGLFWSSCATGSASCASSSIAPRTARSRRNSSEMQSGARRVWRSTR